MKKENSIPIRVRIIRIVWNQFIYQIHGKVIELAPNNNAVLIMNSPALMTLCTIPWGSNNLECENQEDGKMRRRSWFSRRLLYSAHNHVVISLGGKIIVISLQHTVRFFLNLTETAVILTYYFPVGTRKKNVDVFFLCSLFHLFILFRSFFLPLCSCYPAWYTAAIPFNSAKETTIILPSLKNY